MSLGLCFFLEALGDNLLPAHSACWQLSVLNGYGLRSLSLLTESCGVSPARRSCLNALVHGPFILKAGNTGPILLMLPVSPGLLSIVTSLSLTGLPSSPNLKGQCDYTEPTWIIQDILSILKSVTLSYLQSPFAT